jgi:hypothetical protein
MGLLTQALGAITSPAGLATAAIAGIAMVVRGVRKDMEDFEKTMDALVVGAAAFSESSRKMRKEEKKLSRTAAIQAKREFEYQEARLIELKQIQLGLIHAGEVERAKEYDEEVANIQAILREKEALMKQHWQRTKDLRLTSGNRREIEREMSEARLRLEKANRAAIEAKRDQRKIEREIMELSAVMATNSGKTNTEKLLAVERTKMLRRELIEISELQQEQIDAQKAYNALGMNTLEDEAKVTALIAEKEKLLKKMVTSQKDMDNTLARIAKDEERISAEKAKQMIIEQDMLKIAEKRRLQTQVRATGGDKTQISYAGAGVLMGGDYSKDMEQYYKDWEEMLGNLDLMIADFIAGSLTDLAAAFGTALATGNMDGMMQGVLRMFGGFMTEIGSMFIAYGVANLAFVTALRNPTNPASPAVLIGAGAALVAIGSAISSAATSFGGGGASGGYAAPMYATGGDNTVHFVLEGDKLKGAINNSDRKSNNFG